MPLDTLTYEQIPISNAVSRAKMQLGLGGTTDNDIWFETLADEAARHLGCLSLLVKKNCKIDIINGKAKLPCGFYKLLGLKFDIAFTDFIPDPNNPPPAGANPNQGGNQYPYNPYYFDAVYADLKFLNDWGVDGQTNFQPYQSVFEIIGNYIHFHSPPATGIATLSYMGWNKDEDGMIIIYENYERAIWNYICYMFTLQNSDRYPVSTRMDYRETWKSQKAWLKGEEVLEHFRNTKQQVQEWMKSPVVDKNWTL